MEGDDDLVFVAKLARASASGSVDAVLAAAEAWLARVAPHGKLIVYSADEAAAREGVVPIVGGEGEALLGGLEFVLEHPRVPSRLASVLGIVADHLAAAMRQQGRETPSKLGELAATTAHELNNLISAIVGRAQLLRRAVVEPVAARSIEVIEQAALDGSSLVRRIRDRVQSSPALGLSLPELVRETIDRAQTRLEGRTISVTLELAEAQAVRGDAVELRQVLTNLLHNAIDAMPQGGKLGVRSGNEEGSAWIEVADSGIGMDPETRLRMFDPFFTTKGAAGTGLGLSVSREIVERHGGRFEVVSAPGEGTRIRVWLPSSSEDPPSPPQKSVPPSPAPVLHPSTPGPGRRILLIDDDDAVREVLAEMLRTADYHVVEAATGAAGVALAEQAPFDLIFTDLGMPDMNGWEVAARVRAERPNTRVGIITGWDVRADEARLRALGVEIVIAKPFRLQHVLDTVAEALDG